MVTSYDRPLQESLELSKEYLLALRRASGQKLSWHLKLWSRMGLVNKKKPSMVDVVVHVSSAEEASLVADSSLRRSYAGKRNQKKVPKKIHKAEREKLKRDQLNDLFLDLANALELAEQNSGKAFIMNEAIRFLKSMAAHVECLRKQNANLLSESHYVTVEKNELKDEKFALEAQIEKLQSEVEARLVWSRPELNTAPSDAHQSEMLLHLPEDHLRLSASQQVPLVGSVFVLPNGHDLPVHQEPENAHLARATSNVSKPSPRYPNPADSWQSQLLGGQ